MTAGDVLATLLAPVSWLFGGAVWLRNRSYDRGLLRIRRLPVPVVSVGNLSVGGTGKTPVVVLLARRLSAAGCRPAVVLRGTPEAEEYYKVLIAELEERIADGVAAVDGEQHRFYWEGMPVWGKLRDHAELFSSRQACVVASTYCNSWIFEPLGCDDPFEGMARSYTELFIVRSEDFKERYLADMFDTYGIDGIVYHDAKTCPNNSNCRYGMPQRLTKTTGVPYVTINGDLNDLRLYSEEQARTQFEALIEQLHEQP